MEPLPLQMEPAPHQVTHQHVSPAQLHPPPTCLALGRCPSVLPQPAAGAGGGVGVGQASGSRLTRSQGHGPCIGPQARGLLAPPLASLGLHCPGPSRPLLQPPHPPCLGVARPALALCVCCRFSPFRWKRPSPPRAAPAPTCSGADHATVFPDLQNGAATGRWAEGSPDGPRLGADAPSMELSVFAPPCKCPPSRDPGPGHRRPSCPPSPARAHLPRPRLTSRRRRSSPRCSLCSWERKLREHRLCRLFIHRCVRTTPGTGAPAAGTR